MSSNGFKFNDEVFCSFLDESDVRRDGWFFVVEIGQTAVIIKTKDDAVLFIPIQRVLKIKKKGERE